MPPGKSVSTPKKERQRAEAIQNPHYLPAPTTRLIGRRRELARIKRRLASSRLVTLTGPGGCGKTRLALAAAEQLVKAARFEHGVWFIDLASFGTPDLILQEVANTLGVPETPHRPLIENLTNFLEHKTALFVLDNCEHLLPHGAVPVRTLLDRCPQVRILATSREPLGLADETVWLVPSLTLPEPGQSPSVAQWANSEAIQLFTARAQAALPEFTLTESNALVVEKICRRLDGIPLAIELAAARLKVLEVEQIASRLEDSMQLLARGNAYTAARHQTMRAALDWSYALLNAREQQLFRTLSIFADGFTLEAAEAVCADQAPAPAQEPQPDVIRPEDVLDLLTNLVEKSLVLIAARAPEQSVRYRLLEPIRQYALMELRRNGQEAQTHARHLDYYMQLAESIEPHFKGANQTLWLNSIEIEHDNLRVALVWSTQNKSHAIPGMRLATALRQFWHRCGYWSEGRRWLANAIENSKAGSQSTNPESRYYLARAIVAEGWLAYHQGDYSNVHSGLERALPLAQAAADFVTTAIARGLQAQLQSYVGNIDRAILLAEQSVADARRSLDAWTICWTLQIHGMIQYRRDEAVARIALEEGLELARAVGDNRLVAAYLNVNGYITANAGEPDAARGLFEQALAIGVELGDKDLQFKEYSNLAGLALLQGDTARAAELYEIILAHSRVLGLKEVTAGSLIGLGHIRIAQGDLTTARKFLRESWGIAHDLGMYAKKLLALAGLARIAAAQGHAGQGARAMGAIHAYLQAISTRVDADDHSLLEQDLAAIRAGMTTDDFEMNFREGGSISLEQAAVDLVAADLTNHSQVKAIESSRDLLQLCALGATRVILGERAISNWQYARVKELLFYLASYNGRTKAQIGLALWPEASTSQLRNSLGTGLYHLRRALGGPDWIVFDKDGYRFNRTLNYSLDVERFESNLEQAARVQVGSSEIAVNLLEQALRLYAGDFVQDFLEGDWFLLRREELRRKYLDAWLTLGRLHFERQDYARAADAFRRAIEKDNLLEQAHRELIRSYARVGERGLAIRQYQFLEQVMRDELGASPAPESAALWEHLQRGEMI